MNRIWSRFLNTEAGVTSIEYAFIAMLIALAVITALPTIGTELATVFTKMGTALTTANAG
jgi:pilus assembly protein Flp/PilA